jgi:YHS domain-containing protein
MPNTESEPRTNRDPSSERPHSTDIASDPVCGMDVNPNEVNFRSESQRETVYFCSQACKTKFDKHPEKYT